MSSRVAGVPSSIGCKAKRQEVYAKVKKEKRREKTKLRRKRKREEETLGADAPPKQKPRTLESAREKDATVVEANDEEVIADEETDEFADLFSGEKTPKIMMTTPHTPNATLFPVMRDIMEMIPNTFYYKRGKHDLKKISKWAANKDFTHLVIFEQKKEDVHHVIVSRLPEGPTAKFRLTNLKLSSEILGAGRGTSHKPEVILNNFTTRLGHRVSRLLGSLVAHVRDAAVRSDALQAPDFEGRQAVTFHNQRDFIFVRHHRYIFDESGKKARLQEIGPRFTLKLKWLGVGSFDTQCGEFEWMHHSRMNVKRTRFFL